MRDGRPANNRVPLLLQGGDASQTKFQLPPATSRSLKFTDRKGRRKETNVCTDSNEIRNSVMGAAHLMMSFKTVANLSVCHCVMHVKRSASQSVCLSVCLSICLSPCQSPPLCLSANSFTHSIFSMVSEFPEAVGSAQSHSV